MPASQVAVIVPAAGKGTRLGGERKQFRLLGEKPLLIRSLEVFQLHSAIDSIVVVVPAGEEASVLEVLEKEGLTKVSTVVAGGNSRQSSVLCGLRALPDEVEIVLVHDGVRPFVSAASIANVVSAIEQEGAAALAVSVADTLRAGVHGVFRETMPRAGLFRMQTPQGCRRDWFVAAHAYAIEQNLQATDDVDLIQQAGYPVKIVEGSSLNIKITTRADWDLACIIWPAWRAE